MSWKSVVTTILAAALLSACGSARPQLTSSSQLVAAGQLTPVSADRVAGTLAISGSSTVYPLTLQMARAFRNAGADTNIASDFAGTGSGFRAFCSGAPVDIVNASRPITNEERANCRAVGREPVAFQIGADALAVVVAANNTFARSLSFAQLEQIYTGQASRWSQVDPSFPDQPIAVFSPGVDSGTFDFFVDHVLGGDDERILTIAGITLSEDDEVLRRGVQENPYAIGYFGYAYYTGARGKLRAISIDEGSGAVEPSAATVANGSYPLARPLFIYSSAATLRDKPEAAAFVSYYLQYVDLHIETVGYFPATPGALIASRTALVDAI